jgi:putative ABC transport system permease protein
MRLILEGWNKDLRHGVRILLRAPGFAVVALLTLALGIGATTAIFSVINTILLNGLPYHDADRLVVIDEYRLQHGSRTVSWMDFQDWREQSRVFEDMAAYRLTETSLRGRDNAALLSTAEVSSPFFGLLGTRPLLGRVFTEQDDKQSAIPTVVISYSLWKTQLGGNPDVVGRTLDLNTMPYLIIGVLPAEFSFFDQHVDAYLPVGLHAADPEWRNRQNHPDLFVLARLRKGMSLPSARMEFSLIMRRLEQSYPQSNTGLGATLTGLYQFRFGRTQALLAMLFVSVGCVLLIACANVSNLLLARSSTRRQEMAIRAAVGASRWRLARQTIAESCVLSLAGGALGIGFAFAALHIVVFTASRTLPQAAASKIDGTVLLFTLCLSLASGLLFGCLPAVQTAWGDLNSASSEVGRGGGSSRHGKRVRSAVLVGEIAIALVLLTCSGLVIRSLANAMKADPGFEASHLLTLNLTVPPTKYVGWGDKAILFTQAVDRLKLLPNVRAAGAAACPPLSGICVDTSFMLADHPVASVVDLPTAASNIVTPGYLEAMQSPLLSGRFFSEADNQTTRLVAIINQSFAARYWPHESAIGKKIREGGPEGGQPYREIVGVVGNVKQSGMDIDARPEVFLPLTQAPFAPWTELHAMTFIVRTNGKPESIADSAKSKLLAMDKDLPVTSVRAMTQYISDSLTRRKFSTLLLASFALIALLLAAVGIYGVMAYNVKQSSHEIGVRMALGASPASIRNLVLGKAVSLAATGIAIGAIGVVVSTHWLGSMLFGVRPADPLIFGIVAFVLLAVAVFASSVPIRDATTVDPATIVRGS